MINNTRFTGRGLIGLVGPTAMLVAALLLLLGGCNLGGVTGGETIKWEVTGNVTGTTSLDNRFGVDWSITYPNGGTEDLVFTINEDDLPTWIKEETLDAGSEVSLAVKPRPDTVQQETFTLDLELTIYSDGEVVAAESVKQTISPDDSDASIPEPPLSYTVGE